MRVCAGYYRYEMDTTIDGDEGTMEVEIFRTEDGSGWIQKIKVGSETMPEYFSTKGDALDSAKRCAEKGWEYRRGLGWCLIN